MAKTNGRKTQPRKGALKMSGTIRMMLKPEDLREIAKGRAVNVIMADNSEVYLQFEKGDENRLVELNPYFDAEEIRVSIKNSLETDRELVDWIEIRLVDAEARSFGFTINADQAEAIAGVLSHYVQAWRSVESLRSAQKAA
jgi:hypothetical protein